MASEYALSEEDMRRVARMAVDMVRRQTTREGFAVRAPPARRPSPARAPAPAQPPTPTGTSQSAVAGSAAPYESLRAASRRAPPLPQQPQQPPQPLRVGAYGGPGGGLAAWAAPPL